MARSAHPQPSPHGTAEAIQVRAALLELLSNDLALALELIVETDDERGGLRTLLGYVRQVVPGRSKRAKPVERLVPPAPEVARAALRACPVEELRTRVLPPLARAFRAADPEARLTPMDKAAKLVIDLARWLASPTWREQLHTAHALLLARREAAVVAAEEQRRARAEARRPWAADEVHEIAGHPVQRTDDGAYRCTVCGWLWKRKPRTETTCPGLPRYVKRTVPEHLKTERQLRKDARVVPTGPAVAVLHLRHQHGVDMVPLYDVTQVRPLQQRAPARRRCQHCRAFIEREAADQQHCASCALIVAEEQAQQEARRQARREEHERRLAENDVLRNRAPPAVGQLLDLLRDLWLLNRRARSLNPDRRADAYLLKDAVLAALWRSTGAATAVLIRNVRNEAEATAAHFGLHTWDLDGQHAIDLGEGADGLHLGVTISHVEAQSGYDDWRSYLALTFFYGQIRYPFHAPYQVARTWFPLAQWSACKRWRWAEERPFTFGGGVLSRAEAESTDWTALLARLSAVTSTPDKWQHLRLDRWYSPPFNPWEDG